MANKTRWLVMVYMVAKNVPGEAGPLTREADDDIQEMEDAFKYAPKGVTPSDHVRVVYQLHTEERNERKVVGLDGVEKLTDGEDTRVADGRSLLRFVVNSVEKAGKDWNFGPSDRSMLVMWGHAYRFGIGAALTANGSDAIDFDELSKQFRAVQRELQKKDEPKPTIDILAFDTCDLATVEMAVQMRPFADFLLASQIGMPLPGWPYDRILKRLVDPKGDPMEPAELSSYIIRRFCEHYRAEKRTVALSVLNLAYADQLARLVDELAREMAIALDGDDRELERTQQAFERAQTALDKPFVDVATLCLMLSRYSGSEEVRRAALELGDFLVTPLASVEQSSKEQNGADRKSRSDLGTNKAFVGEYGRNACEAGGLQGVSLYAPNVLRDTYDWMTANHWYEKLLFTKQQTIWHELVRALASPQ